MNTELPELYRERMKSLLGSGLQDYINCLEKAPVRALRLQRMRCPGADPGILPFQYSDISIPWEEMAVCLEEPVEGDPGLEQGTDQINLPGRHPYHDAGIYYIQDPSAMAPVYFLDPQPGERVLDLCAAPGGKTTQIADRMRGKGLLFSNEYDTERSHILSSNIERLGIANCITVNSSPQELSERFSEYFNRILVDAPCSGEGMMRKNPEALRQWDKGLIDMCADRQRMILSEAVKMLMPGGRLVYSTCTFAPEEDEEMISWLLREYPELSPVEVDIPASSGALYGLSGHDMTDRACVRLFPHLTAGEGHFVAVLEKKGLSLPTGSYTPRYEQNTPRRPQGRDSRRSADNAVSSSQLAGLKEFMDRFVPDGDAGHEQDAFIPGTDPDLIVNGKNGELLLLPPDTSYRARIKGLRVIREGLKLGVTETDRSGGMRFTPDHALSHALYSRDGSSIRLDTGNGAASSYLRGEAIRGDEVRGYDNGWYLVCADSYSMGWGKMTGGTLKNHYPKGLRR